MRQSQSNEILKHLKQGEAITPLSAFKICKATRLSAIIYALRKEGYNITTTIKYSVNEYGNTTGYAEYRLVEDATLEKELLYIKGHKHNPDLNSFIVYCEIGVIIVSYSSNQWNALFKYHHSDKAETYHTNDLNEIKKYINKFNPDLSTMEI